MIVHIVVKNSGNLKRVFFLLSCTEKALSYTYTKLVQRAMREGHTKLLIIKALITGPPGPALDISS